MDKPATDAPGANQRSTPRRDALAGVFGPQSIKDRIAKIIAARPSGINQKLPRQLSFGQPSTDSLPPHQRDFNHVTTPRLPAKTAGPQVGNQDETLQLTVPRGRVDVALHEDRFAA